MAIALVAAACDARVSLDGTLAYSERGTGSIRLRDLATGEDRVLDPGRLGSVTIAPDGEHVAYLGSDQMLKVADRAGTITPLVKTGAGARGEWVGNELLLVPGGFGTVVFRDLTGMSRIINQYGFVIDPDKNWIAYVAHNGDLFIERLDGTDRQLIDPSPDPTQMYPGRYPLAIAANGAAVVLEDANQFPTKTRIVWRSGPAIDVPDTFGCTTAWGADSFIGASPISADGSELLVQTSTALVALSIQSGATRTLAAFDDNASCGGAGFLGDGRVAWVRVEDHSQSDVGLHLLSLHLIDNGRDHVIAEASGYNVDWSTIALLDDVAIVTDASLVVRFDGSVIAANGSTDRTHVSQILGHVGESGVIAESFDHEVWYVGRDGTGERLVSADVPKDLLGPAAAYASVTPP
jgi:hypothetical protein